MAAHGRWYVGAMRLAALALAPLVLACGPKGSKVTVLEVHDEVVDRAAPTVAGAEELTFRAADGVTIAGSYWAPREATAGCVLFAHQLSSTRAEYVPVIERLVGRAHLYAIDLRGHGASTAGPDGAVTWKAFETADWERVEDDLLGALDALAARGAGRGCVVVGASIGSSAALRLAGAHPDRVTGVVLLSPGLAYRKLATPDAARATRAPVLIVHSHEQGADDAARALADILRANPVAVEIVTAEGDAHGMKIVSGDPGMLAHVVGFVTGALASSR